MCMQIECPNHPGKRTWWGCGGHIEQALAGVPASDRCKCEHEPDPTNPGKYRVAPLPEMTPQEAQEVKKAST